MSTPTPSGAILLCSPTKACLGIRAVGTLVRRRRECCRIRSSLSGHRDCHDVRLDDVFELCKIVLKHLHKLARSGVVRLLVAPCLPRLQDTAVDALDRGGHLKAEMLIDVEFAVAQSTVERGRQQSPGHLDGHPLSDPVFSPGPTGV